MKDQSKIDATTMDKNDFMDACDNIEHLAESRNVNKDQATGILILEHLSIRNKLESKKINILQGIYDKLESIAQKHGV